MKCNLSSRTREGLEKCSACVSNQIDCLVEGPGMIHNARKQDHRSSQARIPSLVSDQSKAMSPVPNRSPSSLPGHAPLLTPRERTALWDLMHQKAARGVPLIAPLLEERAAQLEGQVSSSPANESPELVLGKSSSSSPQERSIDTPAIQGNLKSIFPSTLIDMGLSTVRFLDKTFLSDDEWLGENIPQRTTNEITLRWSNIYDAWVSQMTGSFKPWLKCNLDEALFVAALEAFFHYPGLCSPVVQEDAFWEDYNAHRCSPAILFALACRGLAFMRLPKKVELQQCLARKFRQAFLEARNTSASFDSIRLDDLEALALMVDFEYEPDSSEFYPELVDRYLRHDFLVQMTLQCFKNDGLNRSGSIALKCATERQTLLFWHVFSVDAFRCLDKKTISEIPDCDPRLTEKPQGFLDAIISLAVIARSIVSKICSDTAKAKGTDAVEIDKALRQLHLWGDNIAPLVVDGQIGKGFSDATLLAFLKSDCFMQIESCIFEYGIVSNIRGLEEVVKARVQSECLKSVELCVSKAEDINRPLYARSVRRSLVDISPSILRNTCAEMCTWICFQAQELLPGDLLQSLHLDLYLKTSTEARCGVPDNKRRTWELNEWYKMRDGLPEMRKYAQMAKPLRQTVEAASSHSDTAHILERLDVTIEAVDRIVDFIDELVAGPGSSSRYDR